MIFEILLNGAENAVPSKDLAHTLGMTPREFSRQLERERQAGIPICAALSGDALGLFRPKNSEELAQYCKSLDHRLRSIMKTRSAMEVALLEMTGQEHLWPGIEENLWGEPL